MPIINEGFEPKRVQPEASDRLPPGQYLTDDFPVLSLGPTPRVSKSEWTLKIRGLAENTTIDFEDLLKMPSEEFMTDIHCVTKWSKFDTMWTGVSMDHILAHFDVKAEASHCLAGSSDTYTTNIPINDLRGGKAWIAYKYNGDDIHAEHGGPVRLLVPHLYFWKSAKWLKELKFLDHDVQGFWEERSYHNYGDPWKEQRYS